MKQLPGLAIQRLMEKGFGAEGDWKTAAMVRIMKIMTQGMKDAMGIEAVYIDKDTTIRQFKNELRWNALVYKK